MKRSEEVWEEARQECYSNNNQSSRVIALIAMENYAKQFIEEAADIAYQAVDKEKGAGTVEYLILELLDKV